MDVEQVGSGKQKGEGFFLDLFIKKLIPSLVTKFGEKAGEQIGEVVTSAAKRHLMDRTIPTKGAGKSGVKQVVKNIETDLDNPHLITKTTNTILRTGLPTGEFSVYPGAIASPPPKKKGSGVLLAGQTATLNSVRQMGRGCCKFGSGAKRPAEDPKTIYDHMLRKIEDKLGTGITDSDQLGQLGVELFGDCFGGVFSSDDMPKKLGDKLFIVNSDKQSEPGKHWMAVAGGHVYDSFGSTGSELGAIFDRKMKTINTEKQQKVVESNCGQRAMTFLVCYHIMGPEVCNKL